MSSRKFINQGNYQLVLDNGRLVVRRPDATTSTAAISFEYTDQINPGFLGVNDGVLKYGAPIYAGSPGESIPFDVYHEGRPPRVDEVDFADQPAPDNVFYVAENGIDSNDGRTLSTPLRTIRAAAARAHRLQAQRMQFAVIEGQTQDQYNNLEDLRGRGVIVAGGTGHSVNDIIELPTGTALRVDAVDGSGAVTEFEITQSGQPVVIPGRIYGQSSTTGSGTGFELKVGIDNVVPQSPVRPPVSIFVKAGRYTENNPILVNRKVAVWGDTLRSAFVSPRTKTIPMRARISGVALPGSPATAAEQLATNRTNIINSVIADLSNPGIGGIYAQVLDAELAARYQRDMDRFLTAMIEDLEAGVINRVDTVAMDYFRQVNTVFPNERQPDPQGEPSPTVFMLNQFAAACENTAPGTLSLAEVFANTLEKPEVLIRELIATQTHSDYNGAGNNGTFTAGEDYNINDVITLINGTQVIVDAVGGGGEVTQFTVDTVTGTAVVGEPVVQTSVSPTGGTGFTITPGTSNVQFIVQDIRPAEVAVDVNGGEITNVNIVDGGYGYRQTPEPAATLAAMTTVANPGDFDDAARLLRLNRDYIKERVIEYVEFKLTVEDPVDPDWEDLKAIGLSPENVALCKRDTGYILDAVIQDLRFGGNSYSVDSAVTYRDNTKVLPPAQKLPTVDSFNQIISLAEAIIRKQVPAPLFPGQGMTGTVTSGVTDVTDPENIDTVISGLITGINDTITNPNPDFVLRVVGVLDERPGNTENSRAGVIEFDIENHRLTDWRIVDPGENLVDGEDIDATPDIPHPDDSYDLFYVNTGCYFSGMTFNNLSGEASAVAFDPQRRDPLTPAAQRGHITTSPYVQNCSTINLDKEGGVGMKINGKHTRVLRSMVCDAFTQINTAGTGVHLLNRGYAQLVSIFTVSTNVGLRADTGGLCSVANSNSSFGNFGLVSRGVSDELGTGTVISGDLTQFDTEFTVTGLTRRPAFGDAVLFDLLYESTNPTGSQYLFAGSPGLRTIISDEPRIEIIDSNGVIPRYRYEILERAPLRIEFINGFAPNTTPNPVRARLRKYYTVNAATPLGSNGESVVTLDLGITEEIIPNNTAVKFYQRSLITTSSHTMEYVGGGTDFLTAIPAAGGTPIRVNEIVEDPDLGGSVFFTSTDDRGDFRIGPELTINRNTGTITGEAFERSLFAILTPYILSLES